MTILTDAMTVSLLGSHFYGQRDFGSDGSYTTTRWFTVFYLPLVPLSAYCAVPTWPQERRELLAPVAGSLDAECDFQPCARSGRQVFFVYAFVLLMVAWLVVTYLYFTPRILGSLGGLIGIPLLFLLAVLPLPIPWFLRYAARKKMRGM